MSIGKSLSDDLVETDADGVSVTVPGPGVDEGVDEVDVTTNSSKSQSNCDLTELKFKLVADDLSGSLSQSSS